MVYVSVHLPSTFHTMAGCVICYTIHPKPINCFQSYPSHRCTCFTILLPNSHWFDKALLPTYKMLSLSAPHFWGLACSSISPTVSRAADLAGLLPSSSCIAVDKGAKSQPWHEYHHATTHPNSRPKGRWKKRGDQRKSRKTPQGPDQSRTKSWAGLPGSSLGGAQQRCCPAGELQCGVLHPSSTAGGKDRGSTFVHIFSWRCHRKQQGTWSENDHKC